MRNLLHSQKGVALVIALGMLLVAIILANVLLTIMLSHSRLTQHQVGRIRAYYAATAGMNLAMENLRTGIWRYPDNCTPGAPCQITAAIDPDFYRPNNPNSTIESIKIVFCPQGDTNITCCPNGSTCTGPVKVCNSPVRGLPASAKFCINSTAEYLTQP